MLATMDNRKLCLMLLHCQILKYLILIIKYTALLTLTYFVKSIRYCINFVNSKHAVGRYVRG